MQQRMNAKEYAKARGLPVETIRPTTTKSDLL